MIDRIIWKDNEISKIIIGTAQLGISYGLSNKIGLPNNDEAFHIVKTALDYGINCFDTAPAYGDSEIVLGKAFRRYADIDDIKIISKVSVDPNLCDHDDIEESIIQSCNNFGVSHLWCCMFHAYHFSELWENNILDGLIKAKQKGIIKYIGVSNYAYGTKDQSNLIFDFVNCQDVDIIQDACNFWDRTIIDSGIIDTIKEKQKLFFVRSIYLQGLLLLSPENARKKIPESFEAAKVWNQIAIDYNISVKQLAFLFALSLDMPLIIGVESSEQIKDNISMCSMDRLGSEEIEKIVTKISPYLNRDIWDAIEMYGRKNYKWER